MLVKVQGQGRPASAVPCRIDQGYEFVCHVNLADTRKWAQDYFCQLGKLDNRHKAMEVITWVWASLPGAKMQHLQLCQALEICQGIIGQVLPIPLQLGQTDEEPDCLQAGFASERNPSQVQ